MRIVQGVPCRQAPLEASSASERAQRAAGLGGWFPLRAGCFLLLLDHRSSDQNPNPDLFAWSHCGQPRLLSPAPFKKSVTLH